MTMNEILVWRAEKFQKLICEKDLAAILFIFPNRDGFDLYFTGEAAKTVAPYDHALQSMDSCVFIKKGGKPTIIHASYLTAPGEMDPLLTHMAPGSAPIDAPYQWYLNQKAELYIDALSGENKRLGLVNPDDLRDELYEHIVKYAPGVEFVDVTKEAHILKAEKCEGDLEIEKEAVRKLDQLFYGINAFLHPGKLERDLMNDILAAGEELGRFSNIYADWVNVDITSAEDGGNAAEMPVLFPGKMMHMGERVNISIIAALERAYAAGCGRCYTLGAASEEAKKYWDLAVKAADAAAEVIKPGATIKEAVAAAVEKVYLPNGLDYKASNWIYGLGLNFTMAEFPMAVPMWEDMPLKEGMFLCIAPKIEICGKDPYCCMDTYVVTKDGCERLTKTGREIFELFNTKY
ncbi:MAG: M24 family metallopeptidase [Christensenellaceae bacterium]|nr:M24 family metallopeptidase [Christensenellaceae bacterium]